MKNKKNILIFSGIILFAAVLRIIFYFAYTSRGGNGFEPDTGTYLSAAKSFVETGNFGISIRTPGYPFILAVLIKLKGDEYYPLLVAVQAFLNITAIFHLFLLCKRVFNSDKVALIAATIAAVNFFDIYYTTLILSDSTAQTFIIIGTYYYTGFIYEFIENKLKWFNFSAGTAAFIIAMLIRPSFMYLPAAFIIGFLGAGIYYRVNWIKLAVRLICLIIIYIAPIMIWTSHNREYIAYDGYTPISDLNIYQYNSSVIYAKQNNISYHDATELFFEGKDLVYQEYRKSMGPYQAMRKRGLELIRSDIPYYLLYCGRGVLLFYGYPGIMDLDKAFSLDNEELKAEVKAQGFSLGSVLKALKERTGSILLLAFDLIFLILQFALMIFGMIKTFRIKGGSGNDLMAKLLVAGVILYCTVVYCQPVGAGAYSRFRTSVSMIVTAFAIYGVFSIVELIRNRKQPKTV